MHVWLNSLGWRARARTNTVFQTRQNLLLLDFLGVSGGLRLVTQLLWPAGSTVKRERRLQPQSSVCACVCKCVCTGVYVCATVCLLSSGGVVQEQRWWAKTAWWLGEVVLLGKVKGVANGQSWTAVGSVTPQHWPPRHPTIQPYFLIVFIADKPQAAHSSCFSASASPSRSGWGDFLDGEHLTWPCWCRCQPGCSSPPGLQTCAWSWLHFP